MSECKVLYLSPKVPTAAISNIIYLDPKWDATTGKAYIRKCYSDVTVIISMLIFYYQLRIIANNRGKNLFQLCKKQIRVEKQKFLLCNCFCTTICLIIRTGKTYSWRIWNSKKIIWQGFQFQEAVSFTSKYGIHGPKCWTHKYGYNFKSRPLTWKFGKP